MNDKSNGNNNPFPPLNSLQRLAISESGFVFDPVSGHNFTVNETGLTILRSLQKSTELDPLLNMLTDAYEVSPRELERDVLEFAGELRDYIGD